jgi:hypothetical protein
MNKNEKIAQDLMGMESTGKTFTVNGKDANDMLLQEQAEKFNEGVSKINNKFEKHNQALQDYAKAISHDINGLEIMPGTSYLLIKPFEKNPFQEVKIEGGIITDLGGMTPEYKSNETGEIEQEKEYIKVGTVIETGYECKFVKPGDVVFYTIASECMIPFFRQGFVTVAENRVMAIVNENLTERKKNYGNK